MASSPNIDAQAAPAQPPLFTLDCDGLITAANPAAHAHLGTSSAALIGKPVVELVYSQPNILASLRTGWNWEQLLACAQLQPLPAYTHCTTATPRLIHLHLQPVLGPTSGYFATLAVPPFIDRNASLLENLAQHPEIGAFDIDLLQNTATYTPSWKRILGYTEAELSDTYDTWLSLIHPDDTSAAPHRHKRRPGQTLHNFSAELRLLHRDGHHHWVHCLGTQHYSPLGKLEQISGLQIDIHERKSCEQTALLSEDRLQALAADQQLAAFDLDFQNDQHWFSSAWRLLLPSSQRRRAPTLAQILPLLATELHDTPLRNFLEQHSPGAPHLFLPLTLTDHQNHTHRIRLSLHRHFDSHKHLSRATGYCILESTTPTTAHPFPAPSPATLPSTLLQPLLDSLHEAILLTNPAGQITHLNRRAETLLGRPTASLLGRPLPETFHLLHAETRQPATATLADALQPGHIPKLQLNHLLHANPALEPHPISWSLHPLRPAPDSSPAAYALLFRDPAALPHTPEELLEANRLNTLGHLASGISHDFNNLLTTILGGISQARDNRDTSFLADSERACLAAKDLTRQLLATAKGTPDDTRHTLAISDLLRDAARLTRAGSSCHLQLDLAEKIPLIHAHRGKLQQVLQNLLVNALHALPPRGGHIWLSASERVFRKADKSLPPGRYVEINVRDNGSGIPPEHLEKIFTPFFTTKKTGTGLGLATVHKIIQEHSGDIRVSSAPGHGTTFSILLPATHPNTVATQPTRRRATVLHGTGRVLLMEDDPDIARITQGMLQSIDYRCDTASHGEAALELYAKYHKIGKPYDIVLLDLTVAGGMGGEETFHQLLALDPCLRAIAASGYDHTEIADRLLAQGFFGYLTKPYRVSDLANAIKDALGKTTASA